MICASAKLGLLIRQPNKNRPMWKIAAGDLNEGEDLFAALLRETLEETGYAIRAPQIGNEVVTPGKETLVYFGKKEVPGRTGGTHEKHYFAAYVDDPRDVIELDAQLLKEDEVETIETKVFTFEQMEQLSDFLPGQRSFLKQVLEHARKLAS